MFWIGFFIGILATLIPSVVFLLWALDKAYNMGYDDALLDKKEEEDDVIVVTGGND